MSHFRILMSDKVKDQLKQLHTLANSQGQGKKVTDSLRRIIAALETKPLEFGEERYLLRNVQVTVRDGVIAPLLVSFGVNLEHRFVLLRRFALMHNMQSNEGS